RRRATTRSKCTTTSRSERLPEQSSTHRWIHRSAVAFADRGREHAFVSTVVCVLLPRFELTVAAGDREQLLRTPSALAPEPGREARVGEVSPAAEAFGIHAGTPLGEALARYPSLALVPPDPAGVADRWERLLVRLESIGAAVEPERPGLACFSARGLLRLHGGSLERVLAAARRALRQPARF